MQPLPLFPLPQVLVPGLVLPLHVFEPRYRALAEHLAAQVPERRVFGVVALRPGRDVRTHGMDALHTTGCTAVVRDLTPLEDGRYEMVTTGALRFRLHGLDETAGTPYATGLVTPVEDVDGDEDRAVDLGRRVSASFAAYRSYLGGEEDQIGIASPKVVSYLVAAGMVLDLAQRQRLLEVPDTASRLEVELRLLARERALLEALPSLPQTDLDLDLVTPS